MKPIYSVTRRTSAPADNHWHSNYWAPIQPLQIAKFHPASTRHHPLVQAKLTHTSTAIHILFQVTSDRFILCEKTELNTYVCKDSCVEAFLQPFADKGYFNFETNCGGTMLLYYVTDATGMGKGQGFTRLTPDEIAAVSIQPSITDKIPYRIDGPLTWTLVLSIPLALMEKHVGPIGNLEGQTWRGNFFKCADESKYPHWASWAPVGAPLAFHQPKRYGSLYFRKIQD